MSHIPKHRIPNQDDSQQQQPTKPTKEKPPSTKTCQSFCMITMCLILLLLIVSITFQNQEQRVYVKECDVYDCTSEVKAVGKKSESPSIHRNGLEDSLEENSRWQLQKIVWVYKDEKQHAQNPEKQLFAKLNQENTRFFANQSGYNLRDFSLSNYSHHLSAQSLTKVNQIQTTLQNLKNSLQTAKQIFTQISLPQQQILTRLITYLLLLQHGGIFMDNSVTIVERFETWVERITHVPYVNVGDKKNVHKIKPKCVGFFDNDYSSLKMKANVMREYEFERKLVAFPALEDGFLACEKGADFLAKLVQAYTEILLQGKSSAKWQLLNKHQTMIGKTNPQNLYQGAHLLATHIVLQQRQWQLLSIQHHLQASKRPSLISKDHPLQHKAPHFITLAIDSFGLITINNNLGPHKYKHIFLYQEKCYSYLTKLPVDEMQKTMGKVRFAVKLTPYLQWKIGRQLIEGSSKESYFVQDSFVDQYFLRFLPHNSKELESMYGLKLSPSIMDYQVSPDEHIKNPIWTALPNTLWVIWDKGLHRHSKPIIELCFQNLNKSASASNFTTKIVSNNNIDQLVSHELRQKINQAIQNASQPISSQTISDFWRLAIIYENGGVYVDASTYTTGENFDFIRNVTRIPSNMLWNRYGNEPEVFIFWNSLLGCPANWHYDEKRKTKVQWHLSYESNFIAAVKRSEFIKEWLQVFMEWITLPYDQIFEQMSSVNMQDSKWTKTKDRYLLVMDAVKYVVGRRQKLINQSAQPTHESAADFYKIWSLSGQMIGQQKFRGEYNFESRDYRLNYMEQEILNLYKTQYTWEHAEELLGSLGYQAKFFGLDLRESGFLWDNFYRDNADNFSLSKFQQIIHPESVFGKLLFYKNEELSVKLMRYYNELAVTRLEMKTAKMAGL